MWGFLSWWIAQLAGLLPDALTRGSDHPADASILELGADGPTLLIRSHGKTTSLAQARADEADAGLEELAASLRAEKSAPRRLVLRLPQDQVLKKHLVFPLAARRDLKNLIGFEIERETPFARDEIYWNYALRRQDLAHGRLELDLVLTQRRAIDPLIAIARRAGLTPEGIEADAGPGIVLIPLADEPAGLRSERRLIPLMAAAAVAVVAIATPFVYQQWAIASANAALASLEAQAREAITLRQSADQLTRTADFFNKENQRHANALSILAAVTRLLPDDTYLTALTLRAGRLTMTGLSPSAAELVGLLAHSAEFREPNFDSPVVESENGDDLESFTISASLAQAGTP